MSKAQLGLAPAWLAVTHLPSPPHHPFCNLNITSSTPHLEYLGSFHSSCSQVSKGILA